MAVAAAAAAPAPASVGVLPRSTVCGALFGIQPGPVLFVELSVSFFRVLFLFPLLHQPSRMFLGKKEAVAFLPGSRRGFHCFLNCGRSKV